VVAGVSGVSKVTTMQDAVREFVHDGDTVAIEGFTHLICFAAGHEIIRQKRRDLTLARMTPDVVYDQMIGAGVASKLIFSWMGNPGVGNLHAVRRRIEKADPEPLAIEEYSHFGMVCRYMAGAANLPFFPIRSYYESDIPRVNPKIVPMASPYDADDEVYVVPPLKPDVAIVHAQRADAGGDTQIWGLLGCQKEVAFAAEKVIVVVEEVVDETTIRQDPNRTLIPGVVVDAVVEEPFACHPSFAQGYYDRDNAFYLEWDRIAKDQATLDAWLDEWVYALANHREYVEKFGDAQWDGLRPEPAMSGEVDYGRYA
jgi:glutaconate CoA-transferase subunit A